MLEVQTDNLNQPCPLYEKHQGQSSPEPAYIELDCRDGGQLYAYSDCSTNGTSHEVFHELAVQWPINGTTKGADLQGLFNDEGFLSCCRRILGGFTEDWDGRNIVGTFNEDALDAIAEADHLISSLSDQDLDVWDADEWLFTSSTLIDHWPGGMSLDDAVDSAEKDKENYLSSHEVVVGSIRNALLVRALDYFDGEPAAIYVNHIEALLKNHKITEDDASDWVSQFGAN